MQDTQNESCKEAHGYRMVTGYAKSTVTVTVYCVIKYHFTEIRRFKQISRRRLAILHKPTKSRILAGLLKISLNLEQDGCFPVIQPGHRVIISDGSREHILVIGFHCFCYCSCKLGFPSARECAILVAVLDHVTFDSHDILNHHEKQQKKRGQTHTFIARAQSRARSQYSFTLYFVNAEFSE